MVEATLRVVPPITQHDVRSCRGLVERQQIFICFLKRGIEWIVLASLKNNQGWLQVGMACEVAQHRTELSVASIVNQDLYRLGSLFFLDVLCDQVNEILVHGRCSHPTVVIP